MSSLPSSINDVENGKDPILSATLIGKSNDILDPEVFPQGCQFSPDGLCILTSTCHQLRLYNTCQTETSNPQHDSFKSVLTYETGDAVRSYAWYPHMNSADAATCCFIGASRYVWKN